MCAPCRAFRANVTSAVTGDGTYAITGVASGGSLFAQGASLVIIYSSSSEKTRTIVINDGNDVIRRENGTFNPPTILIQPNTLSGFTAVDPGTGIEAKTTFIVGDGQTFPENVSFAGGAGTVTFNNSLDGSDSDFWDTDTHDVSAQMGVGNTSAIVNINIPATGGFDCLNWVAQVFSVSTSDTAQDEQLAAAVKFLDLITNPPDVQGKTNAVIEACSGVSGDCDAAVNARRQENIDAVQRVRELTESALKIPGTSTGGPPGILNTLRFVIRQVIEYFQLINKQPQQVTLGNINVDESLFSEFSIVLSPEQRFVVFQIIFTAEIDKDVLPLLVVGERVFTDLNQVATFANAQVRSIADSPEFGVVQLRLEGVSLIAEPFVAFTSKVEIGFGPKVGTDEFEIKSTFTLGSGSNGINPISEKVILRIGSFGTVISDGSFIQDKKGRYKFEGVIDGVRLEIVITSLGRNQFEFKVEGKGADFTETVNPVAVHITIGDDAGLITVNAELD